MAKPIYVEIRIRGDLDELWAKTQDPELHQRWDLRFTEIDYLPRPNPSAPQRFLYRTRIGLGLAIAGEGESVGERHGDGEARTSALKFSSDDRRSLIRQGSGYWKYEPQGGEIRFITGYDYRTRFGWPGRWFDAVAFRPLMGWATAWSFDRLRRWIEDGIDPASSVRFGITHALARLSVAAVWLYQGAVPKLLSRHPDEVRMLLDAGVPGDRVSLAMTTIGVGEIAFGLLVALGPRRWPLALTVLAMIAATAIVAIGSPVFLGAAFNPVTLNLSVAALAAIAWLTADRAPSARNCLRRSSETKS